MAAGSGTRWGNYLGVPKQMITVDGEVLLYRTIRQLKERGFNDIVLTVPEKGYFGDVGVKEIVGTHKVEVDKFLNASRQVRDSAVFLWGDCYFTDEAMDTITQDDSDLMFFGRSGAGITGKRCGELFAVKGNKELLSKARELKKNANKMKRCASWELYRFINGYPITKHVVKDRFTHINDLTDDFDYPKDYHTWHKAFYKKYPEKFERLEPTININIMAHPDRIQYIPYLKEKLGDVDVIWDRGLGVWDTRKRCLENHLTSGANYSITIQDDSIVAEDFLTKATEFITKIQDIDKSNWFCCNFYFKKSHPMSDLVNGMKSGYIKKDCLYNEIAFAIPTTAIKDVIKDVERFETKDGDAPLQRSVSDRHDIYFSIPSLIDHRQIPSIYRGGEIGERVAWWFADNEPTKHTHIGENKILYKNGKKI